MAYADEHMGKDVEVVTTLQVALPSPPAQSMLSTMVIPAMFVLFLHSFQSTMGTWQDVGHYTDLTSISRSVFELSSPPIFPHPKKR